MESPSLRYNRISHAIICFLLELIETHVHVVMLVLGWSFECYKAIKDEFQCLWRKFGNQSNWLIMERSGLKCASL